MSKRPSRKAVPAFRSEAEERAFWETHDTSRFVDWSSVARLLRSMATRGWFGQ